MATLATMTTSLHETASQWPMTTLALALLAAASIAGAISWVMRGNNTYTTSNQAKDAAPRTTGKTAEDLRQGPWSEWKDLMLKQASGSCLRKGPNPFRGRAWGPIDFGRDIVDSDALYWTIKGAIFDSADCGGASAIRLREIQEQLCEDMTYFLKRCKTGQGADTETGLCSAQMAMTGRLFLCESAPQLIDRLTRLGASLDDEDKSTIKTLYEHGGATAGRERMAESERCIRESYHQRGEREAGRE